MSKFFSITLDRDVILDDNQTSQDTGWSSQHILDEILAYRITKFESLDDVNVSNKQDKQVVIYSADQQKFTTVDLQNIGDTTGLSLNQVSKMGVTGSTTTPYEVDIPINTVDFKVPKVNVLKYLPVNDNIIKTLNNFSNSESNDFQSDEMVTFDDTAHLQTNYNYSMTQTTDNTNLATGEYEIEIDKSIFKEIDNMEENIDGVNEILTMSAIPFDRLLIASGDKDLSYVQNIDYFKLTGTGNNLKVVVSVDSGVAWKTFSTDTNTWNNINLTVNDVKEKGIDITTFNAINSTYWNLLNTNKKIRFAYLLSMDNISDTENVDNLDLQYDGQGEWMEAKDNEYDIIYKSNTLLEILLKFSGDVKINY